MTGELSMSEGQSSALFQNHPISDSLSNAPTAPVGQHSVGDMLRRAREARGLHIAALAVLLKVPVKKLEAMESDRFDLLPDIVFVRALASSVCRTLKIDVDIILAQLPRTDAPTLTSRATGINEPFRTPGEGPSPSVLAQISRPAVLAGLLLVMGALILIFLPAIKVGIGRVGLEAIQFQNNSGEIQKSPTVTQAPETRPTDSQNVAASSVSLQASTVISAVSAEAVSAPNFDRSVVEVPKLAKNSIGAVLPEGLPSSSKTLLPSNSALPADIAVFIAKTETWVEVTDAKGQNVLRRTLASGDVAGASGALPLKVTVGRADGTQVQIRGKVFDVNAVAKDNVAKFEVK